MKRLTAALVVSGALTMGLAACGGGDDTQAFCDQAAEVKAAGAALQGLQGNDIEAAQQAISDANDKVQAVADSAPSEISGDVDTVAAFMDDLSSQLQDVSSPQDFLAVATQLQGQAAKVQQASDKVDAYIADNC